jgi:hypothetical protein
MSGFRGSKIVSPYLVLVFMTPTKVKLNKPLQIGATILEHSKVSLLVFLHNHSLYSDFVISSYFFYRELCMKNFMTLSSQALTT